MIRFRPFPFCNVTKFPDATKVVTAIATNGCGMLFKKGSINKLNLFRNALVGMVDEIGETVGERIGIGGLVTYVLKQYLGARAYRDL